MKRMAIIVLLLVCFLFAGQHTTYATEGGSSYYFPGISATFAPALEPHPGWLAANQMLFLGGKVDKAVLGGRVNLNVKVDAFYNYVGGFYTYDKPVMGDAKLQLGAAFAYGKVDINASANSISRSQTGDGLGDGMISASLYWKNGNYHHKVTQSVYVPIGAYTDGKLANAGKNYWGFDTTYAMTWVNMKTGDEVSIAPGILFNTENSATNYKSGNEFHVDFALNHHYFKQHYAIGVQGYYYKQLSGDSGSGALLGSFKGEALGIGPAILWTPPAYKGNLSVIAKWIFDVDQEHRAKGDYGQFIIGYKF